MIGTLTNDRGCGRRKKGGVYIETGLSPHGRPLEDFLYCPPLKVPFIPDLGGCAIMTDDGPAVVAPRGSYVLKIHGEYHVVDYIGLEHYPNAADFINEIRVLGISRRAELPPKEMEKLSPYSRLLLIHPRGWINNHAEYRAGMGEEEEKFFRCRGTAGHEVAHLVDTMCNGLYWHDMEDLEEPDGVEGLDSDFRLKGIRTLPCGARFSAYERIPSLRPDYTPAIIGRFPIGQITVIDDPEGKKHEDKLSRLKNVKLPVRLEEE